MTSDPVQRFLRRRALQDVKRTRLRPMTTGEVYELTLDVCHAVGWPILKSTVGAALISLTAIAFVTQVVMPRLALTENPGDQTRQVLEVITSLGIAIAVGGPLFFAGVGYTAGIATRVTADYMVGNVPDTEAAVRETRKDIWKILGLMVRELLICFWAVLLGGGLLLVSGPLAKLTPNDSFAAGVTAVLGILAIGVGFLVMIYMLGNRGLAVPALTIERIGAGAAARRSKELTRPIAGPRRGGNSVVGLMQTGYVFVAFLFLQIQVGFGALAGAMGLRPFLEASLSALPFQRVFLSAFDAFPGFLATWLMVPYGTILGTVVYFERRVRLEGFDIHALSDEIVRGAGARRFRL